MIPDHNETKAEINKKKKEILLHINRQNSPTHRHPWGENEPPPRQPWFYGTEPWGASKGQEHRGFPKLSGNRACCFAPIVACIEAAGLPPLTSVYPTTCFSGEMAFSLASLVHRLRSMLSQKRQQPELYLYCWQLTENMWTFWADDV